MIVQFVTPTVIPLEAFSLLGINVKTSLTAIGRFGTGLKYAIAVILRHGGKIRLFVEGTEYEFYLSPKDFRGQRFQQIRMRKRHGTLDRWLSSKALPFTTEFGKDWQLWQAYRELESNTRDEAGETWSYDHDDNSVYSSASGTSIIVNCPGFADSVVKEEVFLPPEAGRGKRVYNDDFVSIYDKPSRNFYYQGIRVYRLRYDARFTYDFKPPHVVLTEDRTAGNSWSLMNDLASVIQHKIDDKKVVYKMLTDASQKSSKYGIPTFEGHELNFDHTSTDSSEVFRFVTRELVRSGMAVKSASGYYGSSTAYQSRGMDRSVTLQQKEWDAILQYYEDAPAEHRGTEEQHEVFENLRDKVRGVFW